MGVAKPQHSLEELQNFLCSCNWSRLQTDAFASLMNDAGTPVVWQVVQDLCHHNKCVIRLRLSPAAQICSITLLYCKALAVRVLFRHPLIL